MAQTPGAARPECSILVLHSPELDPRPFLHHLIGQPNDADAPGEAQDGEDASSRAPIRWDLENKYYTATIHFAPRPLDHGSATKPTLAAGTGTDQDQDQATNAYDEQDGQVPVVMYLFTGQPPDPLPAQLVRLITSSPRDIALAVRIKRDSAPQTADSGGKAVNADDGMANLAWNAERAEEAFDELGMEVVNELGAEQEGEEDDERQTRYEGERAYTTAMDPLEQIRQTLQTHLWPNMVRKPFSSARGRGVSGMALGEGDEHDDIISLVGSDSDSSQYSDPSDDGEAGEDAEHAGAGTAVFPISFDHNRSDLSLKEHTPIDGLEDDNNPGDEFKNAVFPSLSALRAQLAAATRPNTTTPAQSSAYAGLLAMNEQLALANREFAQAKQEREMASERRLRRLEALERDLMGDSDSDGDSGSDGGEGDERGISFGGDADSRDIGTGLSISAEGPGGRLGLGTGPSEGEWKRLEEWLSLDRDQVIQQGGMDPLRGLRAAGARSHGNGNANDDSDDENEAIDDWGGDAGYAQLDEDDVDAEDDELPEAPTQSTAGRADSTAIPRADAASADADDFGDFVKPPSTNSVKSSAATPPPQGVGSGADLGFEDDFTAPPIAPNKSRNKSKRADGKSQSESHFPPLPPDPTPLLLHLQSIRADLAGLGDEDERRVRAAREVGGLMRSLGIEGWDEGDLDMDVEGGDDDLLGNLEEVGITGAPDTADTASDGLAGSGAGI